tara:strand:+ start:240 stop:443 length:204 start_codon:yes stop_codon:yes gene_type:complete
MKALNRTAEQTEAEILAERRRVTSRTLQPLRVDIVELQRALVCAIERIEILETEVIRLRGDSPPAAA